MGDVVVWVLIIASIAVFAAICVVTVLVASSLRDPGGDPDGARYQVEWPLVVDLASAETRTPRD